ncbi:MAG: hypothetical protein LC630_01755 [Bacteroidales bacterium]|nr:hypothetical protein [Bacteroidales bacterium]
MKKINCKCITIIIIILSAIMVMPGCASSSKNAYKSARKSSYIDTSQLGRDKYFFSKKYQKKLYKFKKR